jgi:hypothetical protein
VTRRTSRDVREGLAPVYVYLRRSGHEEGCAHGLVGAFLDQLVTAKPATETGACDDCLRSFMLQLQRFLETMAMEAQVPPDDSLSGVFPGPNRS